LRGAAVRLAVDDHRVDAAADVVDRRESRDVDLARLRIDLALAYRASVGEDRVVHLVVGDDGESARQLLGQEGFRRVSRQLQKAVRPERVRRREAPVGEADLRRAGLEHVGGDFLALFDEFLGGHGEYRRRVRIERPECEPPPTLTTSVSPTRISIASTGTDRSEDTTCAKLVSWPCPEGCVPITTLTRPAEVTVISARSLGEPIEDST